MKSQLILIIALLLFQLNGYSLRFNHPFNEEVYLATDELYVLKSKGQSSIEKLPKKNSADNLIKTIRSRKSSKKEETRLVYYIKGRTKTPYSRRILTSRLAVNLKEGSDADKIAQTIDAENLGRLDLPGNIYVFNLKDYSQILKVSNLLEQHSTVQTVQLQLSRLHAKHATPDDTLFSDQWHLGNSVESGIDINVVNVWDDYQGNGVVIGIVDDGLQLDHPDLIENIKSSLNYDFRDDDNDPSPDLLAINADDGSASGEDSHGTAVAGLAVARGFNGKGVSGSAPKAGLVGVRLIGDFTADSVEAQTFLHRMDDIDIKNNSWGPPGFGDIISGPGPLALAALEKATTDGRSGKGTIFVWANGNGGDKNDNSNKDGYANSPFTIAVAAVNEYGKKTSYSENGSNIIISAPSGDRNNRDLITSDLKDNDGYNNTSFDQDLDTIEYTRRFSGTSGAAPIVSGIIALMLEANANLNWRDVQEILMRSAKKNDSLDPSWFSNAASNPFNFNLKYGAGLVDAGAAVNLAKSWNSLGTRKSLSVIASGLPSTIPNSSFSLLSKNFTINTSSFRTEHVQVRLSISHAARGELEIMLVSPKGTSSTLLEATKFDSEDNINDFTFMSAHFWGEDASGTWTLRIKDTKSGNIGILTHADLIIHGVESGTIAVPIKPSNFVIKRVTSLSGWMSWDDNSNNETGFKIERFSSNSNRWSTVAITKPNEAYYLDFTLSSLDSYLYRVSALNGNIQSEFTEPVDLYNPTQEVTILYYSNFDENQGYEVNKALNGQNEWIGQNDFNNHVITGQFPGQGNQIRVGGIGYDGTNKVSSVFNSDIIFFPITGVKARFSCLFRVNSNGRPMDDFGIAFYDLSGAWMFGLNFDSFQFGLIYFNDDFSVKPLNTAFQLDRTYVLEIIFDFTNNSWIGKLDGVAFNIQGKIANNLGSNPSIGTAEFYWNIYDIGAPSVAQMIIDEVLLEEISIDVPTQPLNLDSFPSASDRVSLVWSDSIYANTYHVEQRKNSSEPWSLVQSFPVQDWPFFTSLSHLDSNTDYEFRVRAENSNGFSLYSDVKSERTLKQYQDWLIGSDIDRDAVMSDDVNNVGYPLLFAYGLGASTERFSAGANPEYEIDIDEQLIKLTYYKGRDDVTYIVKRTANLNGSWTSDGVNQAYKTNGRFITAAYSISDVDFMFLKLFMTLE